MPPLHFNLQFIQFLAEHRTVPLTKFFIAVTSLGTFNVYIFIVTLIYVAWNKQLAIRLSVVLLITASLDGLLKLIIRNPRPFVLEGTYVQKWAVSAAHASSLARGYSTPSGHAMSAAAFYTYFHRNTNNRYFKILAVAAIVLIGFSRPYLGVHYGEDVLLGWAFGIGCALIAAKYFHPFSARWARLSSSSQVGIAVATSLALLLLAIVFSGGHAQVDLAEFLADAGFLTGIVIARPLELRFVNFDPKSSDVTGKIMRCLFTCSLVSGTAAILELACGQLPAQLVWLRFLLQYVSFAVVGTVNIFLAPLLFTRLGMAKTMPVPAN